MKNLGKTYVSMALLCVGALVTPGSMAATCGSISMTEEAGSTGAITCQAYGDGNITLQGGSYNLTNGDDPVFGSLPLYDTVIATGVDTDTSGVDFDTSSGDFTIDSSVWDAWESIYVTIKEASGEGQADGGWAMFLITAIVSEGDFVTKLEGTSGTGISHAFTVGGTPVDDTPGIVPIPAAVWLFGSGMVGLIGLSRRKA